MYLVDSIMQIGGMLSVQRDEERGGRDAQVQENIELTNSILLDSQS